MCFWFNLKGKLTQFSMGWSPNNFYAPISKCENSEVFLEIEEHSISVSDFSAFAAIPLFPWWPFDTTDKFKPTAFNVLLKKWMNSPNLFSSLTFLRYNLKSAIMKKAAFIDYHLLADLHLHTYPCWVTKRQVTFGDLI